MPEKIIEKRILNSFCPFLGYDDTSDVHDEILFSCLGPSTRGEKPILFMEGDDDYYQVIIKDGICPKGRQCEEFCGLRVTVPGAFVNQIDNEVPREAVIGSRKK